jgi:hypothetical protein
MLDCDSCSTFSFKPMGARDGKGREMARAEDQTGHVLAVFGSSGTAGAGAVEACLADPRVSEVRAVTPARWRSSGSRVTPMSVRVAFCRPPRRARAVGSWPRCSGSSRLWGYARSISVAPCFGSAWIGAGAEAARSRTET